MPAHAGPLPGADMVLSRSAAGWTAGTPLDVLTDSRDALLAVVELRVDRGPRHPTGPPGSTRLEWT
ncbi:hypothetical protein ACLH0K_06805 [Arthrobacter sp. MPF02]|uniref:hypothetical protein n=1 Tax=Arthrobacter sp. MPF02 TaxID=3388492 RepID=UPI0039847181